MQKQLTTGASGDVLGIALALALIPAYVIAHSIALYEVLVVRKIIPVGEKVFTAIILDDEAKSLLIVEELAGSGLAHGCSDDGLYTRRGY